VDWLRGTEKADVLLVHGEQKSLEALAAAVRAELSREVNIAAFAKSYEV
jgi:hypothetical protein